MPKYEFNFAATCDGCTNAAKRVLSRLGVEEGNIEADVPNQKIFITSDLSSEELLTALKKTGKESSFVKEC